MSASDEFRALRAAVLTVSARRTAADDDSGDLIRERLRTAGHQVQAQAIFHGSRATMTEFLRGWIADPEIEVIISSGGTGITDSMPEALAPLIDREVPGFAMLFQQLSYADIGSSGMLSRAMAALAGGKLVFLIPGSTNACRLAMDSIIVPQLDLRTRPCALAGLLPEPSVGATAEREA